MVDDLVARNVADPAAVPAGKRLLIRFLGL
jgi:hypothetical protein